MGWGGVSCELRVVFHVVHSSNPRAAARPRIGHTLDFNGSCVVFIKFTEQFFVSTFDYTTAGQPIFSWSLKAGIDRRRPMIKQSMVSERPRIYCRHLHTAQMGTTCFAAGQRGPSVKWPIEITLWSHWNLRVFQK